MQPTFDYEVDLKLKNILIIMPKFYAYQTKMHDDLIARGANVAFYDEEPEKTKFLILKNLERIFKKKNIFKRFNEQLKDKIIAEMPAGGYDYFLVIRGNVLTADTIEDIKKTALKPGAKTIYYSWDSFANMRLAVYLTDVPHSILWMLKIILITNYYLYSIQMILMQANWKIQQNTNMTT